MVSTRQVREQPGRSAKIEGQNRLKTSSSSSSKRRSHQAASSSRRTTGPSSNMFTLAQLENLQKYFRETSNNPNKAARQALGRELGKSDKQIKQWFDDERKKAMIGVVDDDEEERGDERNAVERGAENVEEEEMDTDEPLDTTDKVAELDADDDEEMMDTLDMADDSDINVDLDEVDTTNKASDGTKTPDARKDSFDESENNKENSSQSCVSMRATGAASNRQDLSEDMKERVAPVKDTIVAPVVFSAGSPSTPQVAFPANENSTEANVPGNNGHLTEQILEKVQELVVDEQSLKSWLPEALKRHLNKRGQELHKVYQHIHEFFVKQCSIERDSKSRIQKLYVDVKAALKERGYCCGNQYKSTMVNIDCHGGDHCGIKPHQKFYEGKLPNEKEEKAFCSRHYMKLVKTAADRQLFKLQKNDEVKHEHMEECPICHRFWHSICRQLQRMKDPIGCRCQKADDLKLDSVAENLPRNVLSDYLQKKVRTKYGEEVKNMIVRVIRCEKVDVVPKKNLAQFYEELDIDYPDVYFISKKIVVFQKIDGLDMMIMAMTVKEYYVNSEIKRKLWVAVDYLDTVQYMEPTEMRTKIYNLIINYYLKYAGKLNFEYGHIWACAPAQNEDFFFNIHPSHQNYCSQEGLEKWYVRMLQSGIGKCFEGYANMMDFSTLGTVTNTFESLMFSGFWTERFEILMEDPQNRFITFNELKKEVDDLQKEYKNGLFYIKLRNKYPTEKCEDPDVTRHCRHAKSRHTWINLQFKNDWEFGTTKQAYYATARLIELLLKPEKVDDKNAPCCSSSSSNDSSEDPAQTSSTKVEDQSGMWSHGN